MGRGVAYVSQSESDVFLEVARELFRTAWLSRGKFRGLETYKPCVHIGQGTNHGRVRVVIEDGEPYRIGVSDEVFERLSTISGVFPEATIRYYVRNPGSKDSHDLA